MSSKQAMRSQGLHVTNQSEGLLAMNPTLWHLGVMGYVTHLSLIIGAEVVQKCMHKASTGHPVPTNLPLPENKLVSFKVMRMNRDCSKETFHKLV